MNYLEEAKTIIKDLLYESWMEEEEWQEIEREFLKYQPDNTYEKLATDLETGVKNGYSVEDQKAILRNILNL